MFQFSGPAEVQGFYQRVREFLHPVLIAIFVFLPWIRINNEPVILLDFVHRHFVLFGTTYYSHDAPLLFFLQILLLLSIFTVTALFGRLWCGWSCPQTVFIQGLFNKIEKLILGSYTKRVLLFNEEDSLSKKLKILLILFIFFVLSWLLSHSLAAYFIGSNVVTKYILEGPLLHIESFAVLMVLTFALFLNFSFFRERLCFSICPYGRFQNAMIDSNSLIVYYDAKRGEPRGKKGESNKGSCVDCNRCVTVCPTKIDIRKGFQLECIACARCIDACNDVMKKTQRAPNLIRYETGDLQPIHYGRFRIFLYGALILFFSGALVWTIAQRTSVELGLSRAPMKPFSLRIENAQNIFQNQIVLHIKNQTNSPQQIKLSLSEENLNQGFKFLSPASEITLEPDQDLKTVAFIEISEVNYNAESRSLTIKLTTAEEVRERKLEFLTGTR